MKKRISAFLCILCLFSILFSVSAQASMMPPEGQKMVDQLEAGLDAVNNGKMSVNEFVSLYFSLRETKGFEEYCAYQREMDQDFQRYDYGFQFCVNPAYAKKDKNYEPADFSEDLIRSVQVVTDYTPYGKDDWNWDWDVVYVLPVEGKALELYDRLIYSDYAVLVYALPNMPFVSYPPIKGDADGDGNVSAMDARLVLRASVGLESFAPGSGLFRNADIDADGNLTAEDARQILRLSVGLAD